MLGNYNWGSVLSDIAVSLTQRNNENGIGLNDRMGAAIYLHHYSIYKNEELGPDLGNDLTERILLHFPFEDNSYYSGNAGIIAAVAYLQLQGLLNDDSILTSLINKVTWGKSGSMTFHSGVLGEAYGLLYLLQFRKAEERQHILRSHEYISDVLHVSLLSFDTFFGRLQAAGSPGGYELIHRLREHFHLLMNNLSKLLLLITLVQEEGIAVDGIGLLLEKARAIAVKVTDYLLIQYPGVFTDSNLPVKERLLLLVHMAELINVFLKSNDPEMNGVALGCSRELFLCIAAFNHTSPQRNAHPKEVLQLLMVTEQILLRINGDTSIASQQIAKEVDLVLNALYPQGRLIPEVLSPPGIFQGLSGLGLFLLGRLDGKSGERPWNRLLALN